MIIIELAYSFHLGSDKNKRNTSRSSAKSNRSGSTSLSNNAIQNSAGLTKVDKHNYRKYDNNQNDIEIIKGSSSLVDDVKKLYKEEFDEAKEEYNLKQVRDDRKIKDYFTHISNNEKNDLACEIIIELGDKKYWDTKDDKFKRRMTNVYKKQIEDLEIILPTFKIASAIIHYDETSPHLHIVGVPIKFNNKNGMKKQVGKSGVFTKESLRKLQDKMRTLCIESFNKEYNLTNTLKGKKKGRNYDYHITEMDNYLEMKEQLEKNQESLNKAKQQSDLLDNDTKEAKDIVNNLKLAFGRKDKYVITQECKDKINSFISQVENTNKEYKNIQKLSTTLTNVDSNIKENNKKIKILTENNEALELRVKSLTEKNKLKDNEIDELKEENNSLFAELNYFKNKFIRLIKFIKNRLFNRKDRDKYRDFSRDLYEHGVIEDDTIKELNDTYKSSKEHDLGKEKDDYDIEI